MDENEVPAHAERQLCPDCLGPLFEYDNDVVECEECGWWKELASKGETDELPIGVAG